MTLLAPDARLQASRLADWYPYWWRSESGIHWEHWADAAVSQLRAGDRTIDPVAVLSVLSLEYVCADRTMVQGLSRLPWLGDLDGRGHVQTKLAPAHASKSAAAAELAVLMQDGLEREIAGHVGGASRVYLLLSGGMDSRVMAGLVRRLVDRGACPASVEAVTWGVPDCRDVAYARQTASVCGWEWRHLELDAECYWNNFEIGATLLGAEVDPKHLHRMPWFEHAEPGSVVLAASYGDSIGRGEYSSTHLTRIAPLEPQDRYSLLLPDVRRWATARLQADIHSIRTRYGARDETAWREVERQAHYMRRMLCHPMCIINRWSRLEQIFTAPHVFGEVWKYDPQVRTDDVYRELLLRACPELLRVPWARTGAPYGAPGGTGDRLHRVHHRYGYWLRSVLRERLEQALFNGSLARLGIFDMPQVRFMFREWQRERLDDDTRLATQLSALATLAMFAERFDIGPPRACVTPLRTHERLEAEAQRLLRRGIQVASRTTRPLRIRRAPSSVH